MSADADLERQRGTSARGTGSAVDPYRLPAVTVVARKKRAEPPTIVNLKVLEPPATRAADPTQTPPPVAYKGARAIASKGTDNYRQERNVPLGNFEEVVKGRRFRAFGLDIGEADFNKPGVASHFEKMRDAFLQMPDSKIVIKGSASPSVRTGRTDTDLDDRRAESAKAALVALGVPQDAIRTERVPKYALDPRSIAPEQKATMRGASIELIPLARRKHSGDGGFTDQTFLTETENIPTDAERTKTTLNKLNRAIKYAHKLGLTSALSALSHYLDGTGTFVEIPQQRTKLLRSEHEAEHKKKFLDKLRPSSNPGDGFAFKSALALELDTNPDKLKAQSVRLSMWLSTPNDAEKFYRPDDQLAYTGMQIKSDVVLEAVKVKDLVYQVRIVDWRSYAVDNYDWEGHKQAVSHNILPSQEEMRDLELQGLARSYQRSSRSWNVDTGSIQPWEVNFQDLRDVRKYAAARKTTVSNNDALAPGELPIPRAAEEMEKTK